MEEERKKKSHNTPKSGRKAEKKKHKNDAQQQPEDNRKRNPKAYALKSAVKAERQFRHKQDLLEKRHHVPLVDRTPTEPPPIVVAVVGPPGSGKSLLIRNLVKNFTRQTLTRIKGPVTIVCGKKRRITLIECENDINCMIDVAKIADLTLLLVDASYGFEMDTFEFLNICQVHGFPRIMGVLTHLDLIKSAKNLKRTKKILKHRFWTEIYQGAKLFYLSALNKGNYLRNEIKNLGRFISVMKFRPLVWRTTHAYLLVDRIEDITPEDQLQSAPEENRTICLFGYGRGTFFKQGHDVHIPGCGDFQLKEISMIPDPCPIPQKDQQKKRSLNEKEKLLYAPFSGVGGIVYDRDAVYIDLKGSHSHQNNQESEPTELEDKIVHSMLKSDQTIDEKIAKSSVQLFSSTSVDHDDESDESDDDDGDNEDEDVDDDNEDDDDDDESENADMDNDDVQDKETRRKPRRNVIEFQDIGSDGKEDLKFDDDEDDDLFGERGMDWKETAAEKAQVSFYERQATSNNIQKLVYGDFYQLTDGTALDTAPKFSDGLLAVRSKQQKNLWSMDNTFDSIECTKFPLMDRRDLSQTIKDAFVTGKWDSTQDASELLKGPFGDFEDLEAEAASDSDDEDAGQNDDQEDEKDPDALRQKKAKLKEAFDASYDDSKDPNQKTFYEELKQEAEDQARVSFMFYMCDRF